MAASPEHARLAANINAKMLQLIGAQCDDMTIMGAMFDQMPAFKKLMEDCSPTDMDDLCERFPSFYRYGKILEIIALAFQSGALPRP